MLDFANAMPLATAAKKLKGAAVTLASPLGEPMGDPVSVLSCAMRLRRKSAQ
jgi:hypothetical protein